MKTIIKSYAPTLKKQASGVPITTYWNNERMIRNHSILSTVREILAANVTNEALKINCIGPSSSGKTTLTELLVHFIHELANEPYVVKQMGREELLNLKETISTFLPINHVCVFDDISWLDEKKVKELLRTMTEIRHLPGGQDIKIIMFFNFHYNFAIPKPLRQAEFFYYCDVGSSEIENMDKVIGTKNRSIVNEFIKVKSQIKSTSIPASDGKPEYQGNFSYPIGKMNFKFTYQNRNPFGPAIFWNRDTARHVVYPKREWIAPFCPICPPSKIKKPTGDIKKLKDAADKAYEESTIRMALRVIAYRKGINLWPPRVDRAVRWLDREFLAENYPMEELFESYGLEEPKSIINKRSINQMEEKEKKEKEEEIAL